VTRNQLDALIKRRKHWGITLMSMAARMSEGKGASIDHSTLWRWEQRKRPDDLHLMKWDSYQRVLKTLIEERQAERKAPKAVSA